MTATMKDPVCGMDVTADNAAGQSEYQGETYYFCCQSCKRDFDADPERYVQQPIAASGRP